MMTSLSCIHCIKKGCAFSLNYRYPACVDFEPWLPCLVCANITMIDTDTGICRKNKTRKVKNGDYTGECGEFVENEDYRLDLVSREVVKRRMEGKV